MTISLRRLLPLWLLAATAAADTIPDGFPDPDYTYVNTLTAKSTYRKGRRGILAVGRGREMRAIEPFNAAPERLEAYAGAVAEYGSLFGDSIRVYCMPVPTSAAYYSPEAARHTGSAIRPAMLNLFEAVGTGVTPVDIYPVLGRHAAEPIYSRTDHHWAPQGAYWAARAFANVAGVPFATAESYDTCRIEGFVGTMARFSRITAISRAPETFEYYMPKRDDYSAEYVVYTLDGTRRNVVSQSEPEPGTLFKTNAKGSSSYLVFLGGDTRLTKVETGGPKGRRLLILKDSFGNPLAGYLLDSFEQIHVADCRYFTPNMIDYISANGITDILFVNNMSHIVNPATAASYHTYLIQGREPELPVQTEQ